MIDFEQVNVSGERPLRGIHHTLKLCNQMSKKSLDLSCPSLEILYWSPGTSPLD